MSEQVLRSRSKVVCVITARHTSKRLPGKVLRSMAGRPMLAHTLVRLRSVKRIDELVIATSTHNSDNSVAAFAEGAGVVCFRGPLHDLLGRVHSTAAAREADVVIRISGDSPLIDPVIVRRGIDLFLQNHVDLVTNVHPRSFPRGQSVEILSRAALSRLAVESHEPEDREHVTRYAYNHPGRFAILNFVSSMPRPDLQLSADLPADFDLCTRLLVATRHDPGFPTVERLIELVGATPVQTT